MVYDVCAHVSNCLMSFEMQTLTFLASFLLVVVLGRLLLLVVLVDFIPQNLAELSSCLQHLTHYVCF